MKRHIGLNSRKRAGVPSKETYPYILLLDSTQLVAIMQFKNEQVKNDSTSRCVTKFIPGTSFKNCIHCILFGAVCSLHEPCESQTWQDECSLWSSTSIGRALVFFSSSSPLPNSRSPTFIWPHRVNYLCCVYSYCCAFSNIHKSMCSA